jgi:hypothetical protein
MAIPDCSVFSFEELPDDSKFIYEALAKLDFVDFATLTIADQSLVLALALHLKNSSRRTAWES